MDDDWTVEGSGPPSSLSAVGKMPLLGTATYRFSQAEYGVSEGGGNRQKRNANELEWRRREAPERETGLQAPSGKATIELRYRLAADRYPEDRP